MSATKTTAAGILKNVYEGPIVDQINNPNVLLKFINRNARDIIEGNQIVGSIRLVPSQGLGARGEMVALPTAQNSAWGQPIDTLKHLYGVMSLSGPLIRATESNAAAFNRAIKAEAEGMTTGLALDLQRQTYGSAADDGRVATCGVSTASNVIQLAANTNMRYFEIGMVVDVCTLSNATAIANGTGITITALDLVNLTFTFTGTALTTSALHGIYRSGNENSELHGLEAVIGTGSLHGLNPASGNNYRWQSQVNANFGAFSINGFQQAVDTSHNLSGKWITHIFSQEGPRNAYLAELQAIRRLVQQGGNETKLDGGFSGLEYTGGGETAIWFKDPFALYGTVYAARLADLELKRYADWKFMDVNGEYWLPDIYGSGGTDSFKAVMYMDAQIWCRVRNSHFKLQNVLPAA
jgi:hypothetical protein